MKSTVYSALAVSIVWSCSPAGAPTPTRETPERAPRLPAPETTLDDFEDVAPWQHVVSTGVNARVFSVPGVEGRALGLDFDFEGHGGYAAARRKRAVELPANYELSFDIRGDAPPNDLQIKLLDETGDNVWWYRRANFEFSNEWRRVRVKRRQIDFAWGPTRDRELRRAAGIEFVVAAGKGGGRGTIAIDNLRLSALPVPPAVPPRPVARASTSATNALPALAVDGRADTAWQSAAGSAQELELDLGYAREFGGLTVRWQPGAHATRYDVELSEDGKHWRLGRRVTSSDGGRDALLLPESAARFVRLKLFEGAANGYGLAEVEVEAIEFGATPNAFVSALAQESPRGRYPRAFVGEQTYWTLLALDGARESALVSEDGALEVGRAGFSIEPFVVTPSNQVVSWADVTVVQALKDGYLPLPSVLWQHREWELRITPLALGVPTRSELAARYELRNLTERPLALRLVLAVRPFQVNPPTQSLNLPGGVSPIQSLAWDGRRLTVNGDRAVVPVIPPSHVGLASFDAGGFPDRAPPAGGKAAAELEDDTGLASAALVYEVALAPRGRTEVALVAPLGVSATSRTPSFAEIARESERATAEWREKLNRVEIRVPAVGRPLIDTLRSCLAQILMSREGPMLRPGTRSYARSWIRDGAMMAESLLRLGHADVATEYLTWYAPFQFDNGKVPCCVDARGADPVPENDSQGELIFLAAEVFRFTRDKALLEKLWPGIRAAAQYADGLRLSERTPANLVPERRAFYGLLPPSISHEGYSDKPAYSYWDDFWGLIGFDDAVYLAEARGDAAASQALSRVRDEFRRDVHASLRESAARHDIPFLPGAADRGDFDPTSTTIALAPGREGPLLPRDLLSGTFERYYQEFVARRDGKTEWDVYTPYELRNVGTFVRLGWRNRAQELLDFFMQDRRPAPWNQWAEVVGREPRKPRFIGDMPHAWISSDYVRSILDLFVYERHTERALVLAAGLPPAFWQGEGVELRELRTSYGRLSYSIERRGERVLLQVRGNAPPGGFVLPWPWQGPPRPAKVNGSAREWRDGELRFRELPAQITLESPSD